LADAPTSISDRSQLSSCAHCAARAAGGFCSTITASKGAALGERDIARHSVRLTLPGEVIFRQGDAVGSIYHVISGWVVVHKDLADGRRQNLRFLNVGSVFGLEPAGMAARGLCATAITACVLCVMPRAVFDALRAEHPA